MQSLAAVPAETHAEKATQFPMRSETRISVWSKVTVTVGLYAGFYWGPQYVIYKDSMRLF